MERGVEGDFMLKMIKKKNHPSKLKEKRPAKKNLRKKGLWFSLFRIVKYTNIYD